MTGLSNRAWEIAGRLRRLQPISHDPHWVHLEKCDIERELREIAMTLRDIERGVTHENPLTLKDAAE